MEKFKRQCKEHNAQQTFNQLQALRTYKSKWSKASLLGSGCFINVTALGGTVGFETYVDGESFDKFVRPAIQQAMEHSLDVHKSFLESQIRGIKIELGQVKAIENRTKYTCPECGGDDVELSCMINPNTMERFDEPKEVEQEEEGFCNKCGRHFILEKRK